MTEILKERLTDAKGISWIKTHATDTEYNALCRSDLNENKDNVSISEGDVTCPDCIDIIKKCHSIKAHELMPEYENEFQVRKWSERDIDK